MNNLIQRQIYSSVFQLPAIESVWGQELTLPKEFMAKLIYIPVPEYCEIEAPPVEICPMPCKEIDLSDSFNDSDISSVDLPDPDMSTAFDQPNFSFNDTSPTFTATFSDMNDSMPAPPNMEDSFF